MTPDQLSTLATDVMGWRKEKREYMTGFMRYAEVNDWCWIDADGEMVHPVECWHPDTDLNQALPLLVAYNTGKQINNRIDLVSDNVNNKFILIIGTGITVGTEHKDLASEICKAILERLDADKD